MIENQIQEFKDMLIGNYFDKYVLLDKHLYLNILIYDENKFVRTSVASQGFYHKILMYDEDSVVRYNVAEYTKDKSILKHLSSDKDMDVRNRCQEKLKELYNE